MSVWRQRTMPPLKGLQQQQQQEHSALGQLDPNSSTARFAANNLSRQSLDFDRSESFLTTSQQQQHQQPSSIHHPHQPQNSSFSAATNLPVDFSAKSNISMPLQNVVTERPPPATANHRDRFQMFLERYAPNHAETALRRAQLITTTTAQHHQQNEMMMMQQQQQSLIEAGREFHHQQQQHMMMQQPPVEHFESNGQQRHHQQQQQNYYNDNAAVSSSPASDVDAHSAQVLDIKPDRLRFELCAARSEADQLRRRIVTLTRMNDHLQEKLRDTLLSEREQAVRANSIESQDASLQERLNDAEAEIRELKRRLAESGTALSRTETQLAQCRGRLAAFDHIASAGTVGGDMKSSAASSSYSSSVANSVTELVQTLSTSQYLLSVLSILRFLFSSDNKNGGAARRPQQQQQQPISVHLGGGAPPMHIADAAQALHGLQQLVCGNRETLREMQIRVVGWTPDDMLREIRSVVMTAETMVVRLLTDGAVGTMIRGGGGGKIQVPHIQQQQQQQMQSTRVDEFHHHQQPNNHPQNLMSYLVPHQQQQQHIAPVQPRLQPAAAAAPYDPMLFEQQQTPVHQQEQHAPQRQLLPMVASDQNAMQHGLDVNNVADEQEEELWLMPEQNLLPQPQPQQRRVVHPVAQPQQKQQQQQQQPSKAAAAPSIRGDTISNHIGKPQPAVSSSSVAHTLHSPARGRNIGVTYEAEKSNITNSSNNKGADSTRETKHSSGDGNESDSTLEQRMRASFDAARTKTSARSDLAIDLQPASSFPIQEQGHEQDECKMQ